MKRNPRGFTLVEILIVVIILGILAAIVIPQFTNASNDARTSSVQSTLQTIRSQIELFKIQHGDSYPSVTALGTNFALLTLPSTSADVNVATGSGTGLGPYLQQPPINPANKSSAVVNVTNSTTAGWYYSATGSSGITSYTLSAYSATGGTLLTY